MNTDLFGEEYILSQIRETKQSYALEGRVYRWIALFFAVVGALILLIKSDALVFSILFLAVAAVIFGTSFVHGSTTERYFEAGHLVDGRSCCPRCGAVDAYDMPVPMAIPAPEKKTHFGKSPSEKYYELSKNKYQVCRKCGTQYFIKG